VQRIAIAAATFGLLLVAGCSGNGGNPAGPNQLQGAPAVPAASFKGPNTASTDPYASEVKSFASSMDTLMSAGAVFAGRAAISSGNAYTWTYASDQLTETLTAVKQLDGSYAWSLVLSGTDGFNDYGTGWTSWTGTTSADGKSGSWAFYQFGMNTRVADLVYSTNADGVRSGTRQVYDANGSLTSRVTIMNNPDNSGEIDDYSDGLHLSFKASWLPNGSGSWWIYNIDGVTVALQGTWS
jgi:hypothetical protein